MATQFLECRGTYISSATTTNITAGKTFLHTIVCPIATTGTVTVQDRAGTPNVYFVLPIGSIGTLTLDIELTNGLAVVTSAGDNCIITWMQ